MSNIDFSKPVRESNYCDAPATVLQEGLTLVRIDRPGQTVYVAVDEKGKTYLCGYNLNRGSRVEIRNVPEEPKDHVRLWWDIDAQAWRLDKGLFTETNAKGWASNFAAQMVGQKRKAVKVPV